MITEVLIVFLTVVTIQMITSVVVQEQDGDVAQMEELPRVIFGDQTALNLEQ